MTRTQLALRTFGWAAVGFLVTNGVIVAAGASFDAGNYSEGATALALSVIAAAIAGGLSVLQSLKFSTSTAWGKAASQFVQMVVAGGATLAVADLTSNAAVAFAGALGKLVVASAIGALQAYLVNLHNVAPAPPPAG